MLAAIKPKIDARAWASVGRQLPCVGAGIGDEAVPTSWPPIILCCCGLNVAVPGGGLQPELRAALDEYVNKYKVVVFMKGTAQFPQCGFSNTVVQILNQMGTEFQVGDPPGD